MRKPVSVSKEFHSTINGQFPKPGQNRNQFRHNKNALGFLRRNLYACPQEVKEAAYKGLVRPVLEYGSSVWDPPDVVLKEELESVHFSLAFSLFKYA